MLKTNFCIAKTMQKALIYPENKIKRLYREENSGGVCYTALRCKNTFFVLNTQYGSNFIEKIHQRRLDWVYFKEKVFLYPDIRVLVGIFLSIYTFIPKKKIIFAFWWVQKQFIGYKYGFSKKNTQYDSKWKKLALHRRFKHKIVIK